MGCCVSSGPNEALVKSGCFLGEPQIVPGGRVIVLPCIQQIQRISLNTMTLVIESPNVYTKLGVAISVTGIAQVKVSATKEEMLMKACSQFLGKSDDEVLAIARETMEGHQRAIMGTMTVEEIYKDRKMFSDAVYEVASTDLVKMGISVVSYTLKDIRDDMGYLQSLGLARTAQVKCNARIGEAKARRDAAVQEASAIEEKKTAQFVNDVEIAKAKRDFELNQAAYNIEIQTTKAESEMAYELQAAKTQQKIKLEKMQIAVVERSQQILVQDQEILRRERELDATIRKPAEAERYKMEKIAEANKNKLVMEAQAAAEAIQVRGEAEAFAIEAKAQAEAEQMAKKADAWKDYQDAAVVEMLLAVLPKVAAEIAAPISKAKKVTMISSGNSDIGASKLTSEILEVVQKIPQVVEEITGVSISKALKTDSRRI